MRQAEPALAAIETWFVAHEAELALAPRSGWDAAPERRGGLDELLRTADPDPHRTGTLPGGAVETVDSLVGRAVGACFARGPSTRSLDAAASIVRTRAGWDAFAAAAAEQLQGNPAKLAALVAYLEELVHAFTWAPHRIVHAHRENMCALAEQFRQQPRLNDVWQDGHSRILVRHEPAFDMLRLCDPGAFLRVLDGFPHPEPSRQILAYSSLRMDLQELLELLDLARPCFHLGVWQPCIKAPILVLAMIEDRLAALADEGGDDGSVPSEAFARGSAKSVRAVLGRTDGNDLGHAWLQHLMHRRAPRAGSGSGNGRERVGLKQLMLDLASALSPKSDALQWIRAEHDVWRRDRGVVALSAAALGEAGNQAAAARLMREVLEPGLWATGQDGAFTPSSSAERWLMAAVIGRHPDPAASFEELWSSMASVRDQARHALSTAGGHAGDATVIAVTWFLFGLDALDPHARRALWRSLLRAVREGVLSQGSPLSQSAWRTRYQFLAAHLAHRLVTTADGAASNDLRELLGPLLGLDMPLADVLHVLFEAGVEAATIADAAYQTERLVALLRRLGAEEAWREEGRQKQLGVQSQFSRAIALMADAIEGGALGPP